MLKANQKAFTNHSRAFCRIENNSTNRYLSQERGIEDFLKLIEPQYNRALASFRDEKPQADSIFVVAGFIAYVMHFSPAGMRINKDPIEHSVNEIGRRLDAAGRMPKPPSSLGNETFTELLRQGKIEVNVDPKFAQAIGIVGLQGIIRSIGNFDWEIIKNPFLDNRFFTSDYPIAIEPSVRHGFLNKVVPLAPDIAVRIFPKPLSEAEAPGNFSLFRYRIRKPNRQDVVAINRLIVRCAESIVFYSKAEPWIEGFVKANRNFRIKPKTILVRTGRQTIQVSTSEVSDEQD